MFDTLYTDLDYLMIHKLDKTIKRTIELKIYFISSLGIQETLKTITFN